MKACGYCGRDNDEKAMACWECGTEFSKGPASTLRISEETRSWIEDSLLWMIQEFGEDHFLNQRTILPEQSFFPDKYRGTEDCVRRVVRRVCDYMKINPEEIEIYCHSEQEDLSLRFLPGTSGDNNSAAGLYYHPTEAQPKPVITLSESLLRNPTKLVATIAHELGHVILLGGGRISCEQEDHEYLTDLATVFFGFGIFTANSAFEFSQWQDHSHHGWQTSRLGYMNEEMFAYALAACAWMKNDLAPAWSKYLTLNIRTYLTESLDYLGSNGKTTLRQFKV